MVKFLMCPEFAPSLRAFLRFKFQQTLVYNTRESLSDTATFSATCTSFKINILAVLTGESRLYLGPQPALAAANLDLCMTTTTLLSVNFQKASKSNGVGSIDMTSDLGKCIAMYCPVL